MDISQPERYRRHRRYFVDLNQLYQKKKARVYTGIVLSIFTSAFFLFFAIRPTLITITGLWKEIKDKRVITTKLQEKITALNSAQAEYQKIEKDFNLIDDALPQHPNVSLLVQQLEALARKDKVFIQTIQLRETTLKGQEIKKKPGKTKETSGETGFSLAVSGDYENLKSFLGSLTSLRRLILIDAFTFQSKATEEGLVLNLNAKAFYLKP